MVWPYRCHFVVNHKELKCSFQISDIEECDDVDWAKTAIGLDPEETMLPLRRFPKRIVEPADCTPEKVICVSLSVQTGQLRIACR